MKIIVHFTGGLGNQLFQYAAGRALTNQVNGSTLFWYFEDHYPLAKRVFSLSALNVQLERASEDDIARIGPERGVTRRVKRILGLKLEASVWREKRDFCFDKDFFTIRNDSYLIGFWQSYKYFDSIRTKLLNEIKLKEKTIRFDLLRRSIVESNNAVAVHIRRSDYLLKGSGFQALPLEYYENALKRISEVLKDFHLWLFTDDVDWLRDSFCTKLGSLQWSIVSGTGFSDVEEMMLMASCNHAVIANSSFGWWGAWLIPHVDKIVIAPHRWTSNSSIDTQDLIPPKWIVM